MQDLDIFLLQVCARFLDPDVFIDVMIESFSLRHWFKFGVPVVSNPPSFNVDTEVSMVEGMLTLLVTLLSNRLHLGLTEKEILRQELVAQLCMWDKTHSQLVDLRFKPETIRVHADSPQHKLAIQLEMLQRGSEFQKQLDDKEKNKGKECKKIFEVVYWLAKEELPNRKLSSVLEMIKKIAGVDLKRQFPYSSKGIERELFLTLAQVFKEKIKEKIGNGLYGILTDEVTDISLTQQLVTFIQYYDSQSCTTTTSFLAISNTLKGNNLADAPQIKKVLLEQLQSVGLEVQTMRSFVSDGASVMTGARNGVAKLLKDENPLILSFHCLAHKLALACASSADTLDYIAHCELQLNQSWKLFDNSAKRTATYLKVQESTKNLTLNSAGRKQVAKKLKKACRTRWLSLDKSVEAVFTDFCAIIETLEQLKTEPTGSAADGLLKRMKKVKFIGIIYILHDVLPVLSQLSKRFQRGNVNFSHLLPAIKAAHAKLNRLKEDKECLKKLQNDLAQNGGLNLCGLTLSDNKMQELCSLMNRYIVALQDNINNRFEPTLPQVSAFSIFDIADLPNESDPGFEDYGQAEIKIITNHFYGTKEEEEKKMKSAKLLAQWENFKFEMFAWKKQVPQTLLQPNDRSPEDTNILTTTDWTLQRLLARRKTYQDT
ncbi:zinc finger protein 862-like isoform X2 [Montipora foliosa]